MTERPAMETSLMEAIQTLDVDRVKYLVDFAKRARISRGDCTVDFQEVLCAAVRSGHTDIVKYILDQRLAKLANKDKQGSSAIHYAAKIGSVQVLKQVIYAGSPVNIPDGSGWTALHHAAYCGNEDVVLILLEEGAHINRCISYDAGESPLHLACKNGHTGPVKLLLARNASVNLKALNSQVTPLHLACTTNRNVELVNILCSLGADVNIKDNKGQTALYYATSAGADALVRLLLGFGSDTSVVNNDGLTPLHVCSKVMSAGVHHERVAAMLLATGVPVQARDQQQTTALHLAALAGNVGICKVLLEFDADPWAFNESGETPVVKAIKSARVKVTKLIDLIQELVSRLSGDRYDPRLRVEFGNGLIAVHLSRMSSEDKACLTECLLHYGGCLTSQSVSGYTPLESCMANIKYKRRLDKDTLPLLVQAGSPLRPSSETGRHVSSMLCQLSWHPFQGHEHVVKFLVSCGWDLQNEMWIDLPGTSPGADALLSWLLEQRRTPPALMVRCRVIIREQLIRCTRGSDIRPAITTLPLPNKILEYVTLVYETKYYRETEE